MILGIDLGTTNSLCAVFQDGKPVLIPNAHGEILTPSVVGFLDDGQVIVGAAAKELRVTKPAQTASRFKRLMGTEQKIQIGSKHFTAPELSSLVLKSLKADAEAFLKEAVVDVVISVPAYFNDYQRRATKFAGELAELNVLRIINEPTAAALTYGFHDRNADKSLLVIDLGGGTFDVTVMEIFEGNLEIISTAGESILGGEDFTDRIVSSILKKRKINFEAAELKYPLMIARLSHECEQAKQLLSQQEEATIRIPQQDGTFSQSPEEVTLTRESFKQETQHLLDRISRPVLKTLRDARKGIEDVGDVIFVGGATRMFLMEEFVIDKLKQTPLCEINPDEVVALGAAVQAALIADDRAVDDMVMTDVCPFTLGVEVSQEFGSRIATGYFMPIIHRNTTIPVSKEDSVSTIHDHQTEMSICVYQGEHRKVEGNLFLGELKVRGIPSGPKGKVVLIRFTYDMNGILEVEAIVDETGKKASVVLANNAQGLDEREMRQAVKKLQKLKYYPRDDSRNRRLLLFCEKLVGEVSPHQREGLEMAINQYEDAMASNEREYFESARENLLIVLSELGANYHEMDENESE